jgi:hypothetical protein
MRRLGVFLLSSVVTAGLLALLTWRVDPLGEFYDANAIETAEAEGCLLSDDVVGVSSWWRYKRHLVDLRRPGAVVVGTSRVLSIRAYPGEDDFVNLGLPGTAPAMLTAYFRDIAERVDRPLTVYLGIELFWLNKNWTPPYAYADKPLGDRVRDLLTRQRIGAAFARVAERPGVLVGPWERQDVGDTCLLDTAGRALTGETIIWAPDGSRVFIQELLPDVPRTPPPDDFDRDLGHLDEPQYLGAYYANWSGLASVDDLAEALDLARDLGWTVVGFTPPYSERYVERLSTAPQTAPRWDEFGPTVTMLFERFGYRYVDTRSASGVGCAATAFTDDGWHPDAACGRRLRALLDEAASLRPASAIAARQDASG